MDTSTHAQLPLVEISNKLHILSWKIISNVCSSQLHALFFLIALPRKFFQNVRTKEGFFRKICLCVCANVIISQHAFLFACLWDVAVLVVRRDDAPYYHHYLFPDAHILPFFLFAALLALNKNHNTYFHTYSRYVHFHDRDHLFHCP